MSIETPAPTRNGELALRALGRCVRTTVRYALIGYAVTQVVVAAERGKQ